MKLGIDARWIFKELSGIGVYTRELIRALAAIDKENSYTLFFDEPELMERTMSETGAGAAPNFESFLLPFGLFSIENQLRLPGILRGLRLDVFHSTNYMIPLAAFPANRPGRTRCVSTIHDLIPLLFPDYAPRSKKRRFFAIYRQLMLQVGKRADIIITDSHRSRADVIGCLKIARDREDSVLPIPIGVSEVFRPATLAGSRLTRAKDAKRLLYVGRPDPYKNLTGLIEAFAIVKKRSPFPVQLRLVGSRDARYPEAAQRAASLGIEDDIAWLGYIPEASLVREYQEADLLALPSRYEGFGLPVVEAMASGTPVVCSTEGSLPEVAGDAAIKIHPDDINGLAESIIRVLSDESLADDMRRRGLSQAAKYTWRSAAEGTLLAYRKAIE